MKTVYGPVPSWRFGRSLGVDPTCSRGKICSFDCTYCQLGKSRNKTTERKEYVSPGKVCTELEETDKSTTDVITFSGTGEPTLNTRLGEMIVFAKKFGFPVVVLTNSSFLHLKEVRDALLNADIVSAKLDAPNEAIFQKINQPAEGIHLDSVLEGIREFRKEFKGKLALQMMFIDATKEAAGELAALAREMNPDEIQLDTPLRPSHVSPLFPEEMGQVEEHFHGLPFISVYKKKKPLVSPLNAHETEMRRPEY